MKKSFLILALSGLIFASCGKDNIEKGKGNGDIAIDPTGEAWISLNLSSTSTRNLHEPGNTDPGTAEESKVSKVRAIFFDKDQKVTVDKELTSIESGDPTAGTAGKGFKIPATSKYLLLVANAPTSFGTAGGSEWAVGTTFAAVNAEVKFALPLVTADDNFMMSNSKGDLEPSYTFTDPEVMSGSKTAGELKELTLYTTSAAAENPSNVLSISLDRVVAKVRVYISNSNATTVISDAGWVLNVTNQKFFPVSKRVKTWNENPANVGSGAKGTCRTPFDIYKIGSYRIDPNYDASNIGAYIEGDPTNTVYGENYAYFSETVKPGAWLVSGDSKYCHENTQIATYNDYLYTTQVLLKAAFAPRTFKNPSGTPDVNNTDATIDWIKINTTYFTPATLENWIKAEIRAKYENNVNIDDYPATFSKATNDYLATITHTGTIALPTAQEYEDNYGSDYTAVIAATNFTTLLSEIAAAGAGSDDTFTYYAGGINYYQIMIEHDDTNAAVNEFGEFGVVRNSVYDVQVTAFNNPGHPTIPKPTPKPDEEEYVWLAIKIDVNPWTWYTQNVEL